MDGGKEEYNSDIRRLFIAIFNVKDCIVSCSMHDVLCIDILNVNTV
jgi:hypothetical protein